MFYGACSSQVKKELSYVLWCLHIPSQEGVQQCTQIILYGCDIIYGDCSSHVKKEYNNCKLLNSMAGQSVDPCQYNLEGSEEYDCTM